MLARASLGVINDVMGKRLVHCSVLETNNSMNALPALPISIDDIELDRSNSSTHVARSSVPLADSHVRFSLYSSRFVAQLI
jgi:hypothetical protein